MHGILKALWLLARCEVSSAFLVFRLRSLIIAGGTRQYHGIHARRDNSNMIKPQSRTAAFEIMVGVSGALSRAFAARLK